LEFYKIIAKYMQYIFKKKNMPKYFKSSPEKKYSNNFRIFSHMQEKKIFYFFIFFRFWFGKNSFFFIIKQQKIGLKGVCQTYSLTKKTL